MWDFLFDLVFYSLPSKVQLGCLAVAITLILAVFAFGYFNGWF